MHPVQPDVPGSRRSQPDRHVHRRADARGTRRRTRLVRATRRPVVPSSSSAEVPPGWRPPGWRRARARVTLVERAARLGGLAAVAGPNEPLVDWLAPRRPARGRRAARSDRGAGWRRRGDAVHRLGGGHAGLQRRRRSDDRRRGRRCARVSSTYPPRATWSCSTRSVGRSASPWPKSSATGLCSSPRTTSPATSSPAPETCPGQRPVGAGRSPGRTPHAAAQWSRPGEAEVEDRFLEPSHDPLCRRRRLRLPPARRADAGRDGQAGDCVAPRTVHEAILEGRRVACSL